MGLQEWLEKHSIKEARELADRAGTKYVYLWNIATGRRTPSTEMVKRLVAADEHGDLTLAGLRPDVWGDPELFEKTEAAANG